MPVGNLMGLALGIRIVITGRPGVGKTTLVKRVLEALRARGLKVGGVISYEVRRRGGRVGFRLEDLLNGRTGSLASKEGLGAGPRVGSYTVNMEDLDDIGSGAIVKATAACEVVVVDEVGPMELKSEKFREAVLKLLGSERSALITVHYRLDDDLVNEVKRRASAIYTVTEANRESLARELIEKILEAERGRGVTG